MSNAPSTVWANTQDALLAGRRGILQPLRPAHKRSLMLIKNTTHINTAFAGLKITQLGKLQ